MFDRQKRGERAVLVLPHSRGGGDAARRAEEFTELAKSAGAEVLGSIAARVEDPNPRYFIGSGKAGEVGEMVAALEADLVLVDHLLTPVQERNLEKLLNVRVVDRAGLILDIFAQRARTREGKLQIARSIDYFAFSRGLYPPMPPLAIGRFWWDNWLLWKARSLQAKVVDATKAVLVVHQNHDYSHTTYGPSKEELMASEECIRNARLTCEQNPTDYDDGFFWRYAYTIDDANYQLTSRGLESNPRHLWKQFKRYSSRPIATAKLAQRRFA